MNDEVMRKALERSIIALDDWLNDYAYDMCDEQRVKEARKRISEFGTIGYIAHVQEQNRKALALAQAPIIPEGWIRIEDEKPLTKGFKRLYSFKPVNNRLSVLERHYDANKRYGNRSCDLYIDIPLPAAPELEPKG